MPLEEIVQEEVEPQPAPCDCDKPKRSRKPVAPQDAEPAQDIEPELEADPPAMSYQPPRHKRRCGCH